MAVLIAIVGLQVDARQVGLGADALRLEAPDDGVPVQVGRETRRVHEPRAALRTLVHGRDPVDAGHALLVEARDAGAGVLHPVQALDLRHADGRVHVREPVVEPQARVHQPRPVVGAPLVGQALQQPVQVVVVGEDHPALGGGELLVGVEAVHRRVAEGAELPAVVVTVDGLAGVLHDPQAVAPRDVHQRGDLCRIAKDVDDEDGLGARRDGRLHRRRIHVEREGIHLRAPGRGTRVEDDVGRRHERDRRGDHLVAGAEAQGMKAAVQAGGPG